MSRIVESLRGLKGDFDADFWMRSLSMAEISLVLAVLFRPNGPGLELFETDESDVKHVHDFVVPLPKLESLGVRVMVR